MFFKSFKETSKRVSKQFLSSFWRVLKKFRGDSRYFQECFKEALRKCYENFTGVSKKLRKLQGWEMSRVFQ